MGDFMPERIWKTENMQRLDVLLSAAHGSSDAERAKPIKDRADYLQGMITLGTPGGEAKLREQAKAKRRTQYERLDQGVIGPDLIVSREFGVFGTDPEQADLEEQKLREFWYTDKAVMRVDEERGPKKPGWWSHDLRVSELWRQAIIQAGTLAIAHDLPVDSYWVCTGSDTGDDGRTPFQCSVMWNERQVSLYVLTPAVPNGDILPAPTEKERVALAIAPATPDVEALRKAAVALQGKPEESAAQVRSAKAALDEGDEAGAAELREQVALSRKNGVTIVGADKKGKVFAWPTRADASTYWLTDQFKQPPAGGDIA